MRRTAICWLAMVLFAVLLGFCQTTATKHTENPGFPRVVARISLWHKTGPIKPITVFTPKHFGVYRVSGVVVVTDQLDNNLYGYISQSRTAEDHSSSPSARCRTGETIKWGLLLLGISSGHRYSCL
jgi:hypothetical protein